ncbi:MAG: very short patch repair endonuclease [Terriglobales bacterium]
MISEARRRNMAAIKHKNTTPELAVRQHLHRRGFRFRLHDRTLPGRPDIVLKRYKTVVQVHGCFWHHHGCYNSVWPRTRKQFWRDKIGGNITRDRKNERRLVRAGWRVLTVWECEVRDGTAFPKLGHQLRKQRARHITGRK